MKTFRSVVVGMGVAGSLMLAFAAGDSHAQEAAQQFNLVCEGTSLVGKDRKPFQQTYRVDLARGVWCWDEACTNVKTIYAVEPAMIRLTTGISISRSTGRWEIPFIGAEGTCRKADYVAIPSLQF